MPEPFLAHTLIFSSSLSSSLTLNFLTFPYYTGAGGGGGGREIIYFAEDYLLFIRLILF